MQPLTSPLTREPGYPSVAVQRAIQVEPGGLQLRLDLFSGHVMMMPASKEHRSAVVYLQFPPSVECLSAVWFYSSGYGWSAWYLAVTPHRRRTRYYFSRSFRILEVSRKKCSVQATCSWAQGDYLVAFDFAPTTCLTAIYHTFPSNLWIAWRRGRPSRVGGARRVGGPRHRLHVRLAWFENLCVSFYPFNPMTKEK